MKLHYIKLEDLSFYDDFDEILDTIDDKKEFTSELKDYIFNILNTLLLYKYKYNEIKKDYSKLISNIESSFGISVINKYPINQAEPIIEPF